MAPIGKVHKLASGDIWLVKGQEAEGNKGRGRKSYRKYRKLWKYVQWGQRWIVHCLPHMCVMAGFSCLLDTTQNHLRRVSMSVCLDDVGLWADLWGRVVLMYLISKTQPESGRHCPLVMSPALCKSKAD